MAIDKKDRKLVGLVIGVFILLLGLSLWAYFANLGYDWNDHNYLESGDRAEEPYGASIFYEYLKTLREEDAFHTVDSTIDRNLAPFLDSSMTGLNYVVIGDYAYMDSTIEASVFSFVEQGNSFFLFKSIPTDGLMTELHADSCLDAWPVHNRFETESNAVYDSIVSVNFIHPDLRRAEDFEFAHRVESHAEKYNWFYAQDELFCEENRNLTPLARVNGHVNFYRVKYGQGFFYFHTTPKLFSNYYMVHGEGKEYVQRAMAHLAEGDIIYDKRVWSGDFGSGDNGLNQSEGPLKYILTLDGLRWGFYVLLSALGLMLLFAFRRKQRIIPVIHAKENTSMEYVETISELFYQQGSHGKIMEHLTEQFLHFVRARYRLPTSDLGPAFVAILSSTAGLSEIRLKELMDVQRKGAYAPNVNAELLIDYYRLLNHFYEHCK